MDWLVEDTTHPGADLSLARMTVYPNQTSPAHRHPNANEAIYVLSGQMSERLDDVWVSAGPGEPSSYQQAQYIKRVVKATGRL